MVRHGETDYNKASKFQGMCDTPLNDKGRTQAGYARTALANTPIDVAFCSPLQRAAETARIILQEHPATPLEEVYNLHEHNIGCWEGLTADELRIHYPKELYQWTNEPSKCEVPRGETFQQVQNRAVEAFWDIVKRNPGKTILIVSHMVCLSTILLDIAGIPIDEIWDRPLTNAGLNIVEVPVPTGDSAPSKDDAVLVAWNQDDHIPAEDRRTPRFKEMKVKIPENSGVIGSAGWNPKR